MGTNALCPLGQFSFATVRWCRCVRHDRQCWRQQKHQCLCFHYWDYLTNFWQNNWQSIIDAVERLCYNVLDFAGLRKLNSQVNDSDFVSFTYIHIFNYFLIRIWWGNKTDCTLLMYVSRGKMTLQSLNLGIWNKDFCFNIKFWHKQSSTNDKCLIKCARSEHKCFEWASIIEG